MTQAIVSIAVLSVALIFMFSGAAFVLWSAEREIRSRSATSRTVTTAEGERAMREVERRWAEEMAEEMAEERRRHE